MGIKETLKKNYYVYTLHNCIRYELPGKIFGKNYDIRETKRKFKRIFGRDVDLENPQTLNEKIQWLKLNVREDFHTVCADKYAVRDYWNQYGEDSLIPLLYHTDNWRDIRPENIPDIPKLKF